MDTARIKAIAVLGYRFNLHLLRSVIGKKKPDQAELFRSYFREDRITSLTAAEHLELPAFEKCVACGLCPSHCRVMELAEGRFLGPMHLAITASRSQPDFLHDLDSLLLCAACGQCEPSCPEKVPVAAIAQAMRAMIFRVAEDKLPPAYHEAKDNLKRYGNIYGAAAELDLPKKSAGAGALVLGPKLRRQPERAKIVFSVLTKIGFDLTAIEEGGVGGVAEALGLSPDTGWVDRLGSTAAKTVIVADPEVWRKLRADSRMNGKMVKWIGEAVAEKWPAGLDLSKVVKGPVAVHDPGPLARGSNLGGRMRELLTRAGIAVKEMTPGREESPPVGWEGGVDLVAPELARLLAVARLEDAKAAGAASLIALCAEDAEILSAASKDDFPVLYFMELIQRALS